MSLTVLFAVGVAVGLAGILFGVFLLWLFLTDADTETEEW